MPCGSDRDESSESDERSGGVSGAGDSSTSDFFVGVDRENKRVNMVQGSWEHRRVRRVNIGGICFDFSHHLRLDEFKGSNYITSSDIAQTELTWR